MDGNKRAALTAAYVFLALNGPDLVASEAEVVVMRSVADRRLSKTRLATWLRAKLAPR